MNRVAIILLLLITTVSASAKNIYVAKSGTDGAGFGTSQLTPYKTIQYALDNASAFDSVLIHVDTYAVTAPIIINKPVNITRYGVGLVELDAAGWDTTISNKYMLTIANTDNVSISRITFKNCIGSGAKAIYIHGKCSNIEFYMPEFYNIGWQQSTRINPPTNPALHNAHVIHIVGDSAQPIRNLRIIGSYVQSCATGYSEAIAVTGYVDSFAIAGNRILGNTNIGIVIAGNYAPPQYVGNGNPALNQPRQGFITDNYVEYCASPISPSAGIYIDGAYNCIVERNWLINNGVGISVGAEQPLGVGAHPVSGNIIRNNIVAGNLVCGMVLGANNPTVSIQNTLVCNNTLYKNRTGDFYYSVDKNGGEVHLQNIDGMELQNNIFHAIDTIHNLVAMDGYNIKNFRSDYNLYFRDNNSMSYLINNGVLGFNNSTSSGGYYAINPAGFYKNILNLGLDSNSTTAVPGYSGLTGYGYDFRIGLFSSSYNAGNVDTALINPGKSDNNMQKRIFDGRVDIGALEYAIYFNIHENNLEKIKAQVYPNPTAGVIHINFMLEEQQTVSFTIIDATGKVVYQGAPEKYQKGESKETISFKNSIPGHYIIIAKGENGQTLWSDKVIYQH